MSSSPLSIQRLTHRFQAGTVNEKTALDHLSLEVPAGQFVTVLGSNGSGKTTLFNMILGKLIPDEGRILLDGEDITRQKDYRRALNIGCLYQNPLCGTAPDMTIEENLALAYTRKASRSFFAVNRRDSRYFRELLATLDMGLENRMILIFDKNIAYPIAFSNADNLLFSKVVDGLAQTINHLFQRSKDLVTKPSCPKFFPNLFNGIHLRRIGRDK